MHFLAFFTGYGAAKQKAVKWWIMNRNRKTWIIKRCSIIKLTIKWREGHSVCASLVDWCGRGRGTERRAMINGAPLFDWVCVAVEIMTRLCKYTLFLPYDGKMQRIQNVNRRLNARVLRKTCQNPEDRWSKLLLQLFCRQCYRKRLERVVRKVPVPSP